MCMEKSVLVKIMFINGFTTTSLSKRDNGNTFSGKENILGTVVSKEDVADRAGLQHHSSNLLSFFYLDGTQSQMNGAYNET